MALRLGSVRSARGGPWPPHCVQGTRGAELHPALNTQTIAHYLRKASSPDKDDYSEFEGEDELLFTYVCNTFKPEKLVKELNIYFPQVVRMKMPVQSGGKTSRLH